MIHSLSTLSTRLLLSWKQKAPFYYDIRRSYSVFSGYFSSRRLLLVPGSRREIKDLVSANLVWFDGSLQIFNPLVSLRSGSAGKAFCP